MITFIKDKRATLGYRILSAFIAFTFVFGTVIPPHVTYAQLMPVTILNLPAPGTLLPVSSGFIPAMMTGLTVHPENPLEFDFMIDTGDSKLAGDQLTDESKKLIKYFLASLTVPENELWVNLSPYEHDRIIPDAFGETEMGRDLLAQDYLLKQLTASLMYPENELGKKFWDRVYKKAYDLYGTTEIPMNTFNKVWIVPDQALVFEKDSSAYVIESHLKVMLEEDYLALKSNLNNEKFSMDKVLQGDAEVISGVTSAVVRDVLIPEIEKEVNTGETFANLRQVYNSMILATWYKKNLKEGLLGQVYVDQNKTKGVDVEDKQIKQKIYDQYLDAFKKGVYNYIKEDYDPTTQGMIPRKYFSGGFDGPEITKALVEFGVNDVSSLRGNRERFVSFLTKVSGLSQGDFRQVVFPELDALSPNDREYVLNQLRVSSDLENRKVHIAKTVLVENADEHSDGITVVKPVSEASSPIEISGAKLQELIDNRTRVDITISDRRETVVMQDLRIQGFKFSANRKLIALDTMDLFGIRRYFTTLSKNQSEVLTGMEQTTEYFGVRILDIGPTSVTEKDRTQRLISGPLKVLSKVITNAGASSPVGPQEGERTATTITPEDFAELVRLRQEGKAGFHKNVDPRPVVPASQDGVLNWNDIDETEQQLLREEEVRMYRDGKIAPIVMVGGEATRFGGPKTFVEVSPDLGDFLEIKAANLRWLRETFGSKVPLYLMSSEKRLEEFKRALEERNYYGMTPEDFVWYVQGMGDTFIPTDDEIEANFKGEDIAKYKAYAAAIREMNPDGIYRFQGQERKVPVGHFDAVSSFIISGRLSEALAQGIEIMPVFNIDNLQAILKDDGVLAHFAENDLDFAFLLAEKNLTFTVTHAGTGRVDKLLVRFLENVISFDGIKEFKGEAEKDGVRYIIDQQNKTIIAVDMASGQAIETKQEIKPETGGTLVQPVDDVGNPVGKPTMKEGFELQKDFDHANAPYFNTNTVIIRLRSLLKYLGVTEAELSNMSFEERSTLVREKLVKQIKANFEFKKHVVDGVFPELGPVKDGKTEISVSQVTRIMLQVAHIEGAKVAYYNFPRNEIFAPVKEPEDLLVAAANNRESLKKVTRFNGASSPILGAVDVVDKVQEVLTGSAEVKEVVMGRVRELVDNATSLNPVTALAAQQELFYFGQGLENGIRANIKRLVKDVRKGLTVKTPQGTPESQEAQRVLELWLTAQEMVDQSAAETSSSPVSGQDISDKAFEVLSGNDEVMIIVINRLGDLTDKATSLNPVTALAAQQELFYFGQSLERGIYANIKRLIGDVRKGLTAKTPRGTTESQEAQRELEVWLTAQEMVVQSESKASSSPVKAEEAAVLSEFAQLRVEAKKYRDDRIEAVRESSLSEAVKAERIRMINEEYNADLVELEGAQVLAMQEDSREKLMRSRAAIFTPAYIQQYVEMLNDDVEEFRREGATALGNVPSTDLQIPEIIESLDRTLSLVNETTSVRRAAALSLRKINTRESMSHLATATTSVSQEVRDAAREALASESVSSPITEGEEEVGGIDLNPALLNLQIKRDGKGIPLPLGQQPIYNMKIDGFLPVIINITPASNTMPLFLGIAAQDDNSNDLSYQSTLEPVQRIERFTLKDQIETKILS